MSISSLLHLIALLCLSSIKSASATYRGIRSTSQNTNAAAVSPSSGLLRRTNDKRYLSTGGLDYVECRIEIIASDDDNEQTELDFRCITYSDEEEDGTSNMVYDLPPLITNQLRERFNNEEPIEFIRILGARIYRHTLPSATTVHLRSNAQSQQIDEDRNHDRILVDDDAEIIILDQPLMQRRLYEGSTITPLTGVNRVIVARITTQDSEVSLSAATLSDRFFGAGQGTLRTQFAGCSYNQLLLEPATGVNIAGGVIEIAMPNVVMTGEKVTDFENQMIAALEEQVGPVNQFQHFVLCVPPGSKSRHGGDGWTAYASVATNKSVFNDEACGQLSVTGHEFGHNLRLGHAGELQHQYGDDSGLMGSLPKMTKFPLACFNGAKNWQLGWMSSKALTLKLDEFGPWRGRLYGFTDFSVSPGNVLLKVGDLHIQYNKASGFNVGTVENVNLVTVTRSAESLGSKSWSLGGFDSGNRLEVDDFVGSNSLVIEVCGYNGGGSSPNHDYYDLLIQYGTQQSSCGASLSSPYLVPSPAPTPAPTTSSPIAMSIERKSPSPSAFASNSPTARSAMPSSAPTTINTLFPSAVPSMLPSGSIEPSNAPSADLICDDQKTAQFNYSNGTHILQQKCIWLASRPEMQAALCHPNEDAYDVCEETCGKCKDSCMDTDGSFVHKNGVRDCTWLVMRPQEQGIICQAGHETNAMEICPEACDACDGPNPLILDP